MPETTHEHDGRTTSAAALDRDRPQRPDAAHFLGEGVVQFILGLDTDLVDLALEFCLLAGKIG